MPRKILVVDDDNAVRSTIGLMLEEEGYQVDKAMDGNDALAKIREGRPELILMDVEMPGLGGREVCRIIKGSKNFGFIPVILVTARQDLHTKVEGFEMGADDYIVKPINMMELSARVKSMLRIKALQDELMEKNDRLMSMNERLQELSMTDALTGIYNRLFFQKRFSYEFQRANRYRVQLAVIIMDLDHFKRINDTYGHQFGDFVLKRVGALLLATVRQVDIVARYGGEEIVVVCPETNPQQVQVVAERIRAVIETEEFTQDGRSARVTTSIGVAVYPDLKDRIRNMDDFLKLADEALYVAKDDGRNRVRYSFHPNDLKK